MASAISQSSPSFQITQQQLTEPGGLFDLSSIKANLIAKTFFGSFMLAAGVIALGFVTGGFFAAVPLFLGAGIIFWNIFMTKDYSDPDKLKTYRKEAEKQPLTKTVQEHGWNNLFRYQIVNQENFPRLFLEAARKMTDAEFLLFYNDAEHAINATECYDFLSHDDVDNYHEVVIGRIDNHYDEIEVASPPALTAEERSKWASNSNTSAQQQVATADLGMSMQVIDRTE